MTTDTHDLCYVKLQHYDHTIGLAMTSWLKDKTLETPIRNLLVFDLCSRFPAAIDLFFFAKSFIMPWKDICYRQIPNLNLKSLIQRVSGSHKKLPSFVGNPSLCKSVETFLHKLRLNTRRYHNNPWGVYKGGGIVAYLAPP